MPKLNLQQQALLDDIDFEREVNKLKAEGIQEALACLPKELDNAAKGCLLDLFKQHFINYADKLQK